MRKPGHLLQPLAASATVCLGAVLASCTANPLGSNSNVPSSYHPGYNGTPPTLSSISPSSGTISGRTTLTLTGQNFQSGATVELGTSSCLSVSFVSATELTCVTPSHSTGLVALTVINPNLQTSALASAFDFTGTSTNAAASFGVFGGGSFSSSGSMRVWGSVGGSQTSVQTSANISNYSGLQGAVAGAQ